MHTVIVFNLDTNKYEVLVKESSTCVGIYETEDKALQRQEELSHINRKEHEHRNNL